MKKRFFIPILIACCNILVAQTPHTMDTIIGREPTYFYQRWFDSTEFHTNKPECHKSLAWAQPTEVAKYNYTDSTLKIVGIATYSWSEYVPDLPLPCYAQCADTSFDNWHESLILYKPTDSGMVALASQTYNVRDTTRMMKLYYIKNDTRYTVEVGYFPIYEVYFDEPVIVTDSFYVATTNYNGVVDSATMTYPGPPAMSAFYSPWGAVTYCYPQHYKNKGEWSDFQWEHHYEDRVWIIFPIIDTTQPRCWRPVEFNVQSQDTDGVYLAWEGGENNRTWEVAYGRADEDPEGYSTLVVAAPECALAGLAAGVEYAARVRASCFDNTMYSSWTDTIRFTREGEPLNIVVPDNNIGNIQLMPNPASGSVVVLSSLEIERVEVYDEKGTRVLEQRERNHTTSVGFDVSKWAKGTYVVVVHTPSGTTTKRLVVN